MIYRNPRRRKFLQALAIRAAMAGFALVVSLGGTAGSAQSPETLGSHSAAIEVDGLRRTYLLHRPPAAAGEDQLRPLVVVLHGGRMTGAQMEVFTGMSRLADDEGFLVVYPDGAGEYQGTTGWFNDGRIATPDDVRFLVSLIDRLVAEEGVDPRRVYMTGYSNGAGLTNLAALRLGGRIAAIAPVAGTTSPALTRLYPPSAPMPVMYFHGTDDPFAYFAGGSRGTRPGSSYSAEEFVRFWATTNGCDNEPETSDIPRARGDTTQVRRVQFENCRTGANVVFYRIGGGGHTWPGNLELRQPRFRRLGATTAAIDANRAMWGFFSEHASSP